MGILDFVNKKHNCKNGSDPHDKWYLDYEHLNRLDEIKLYYVRLERFKNSFDGQICVGLTGGLSTNFRIPEGMNIEEACRVISYLSDKVEHENKITPASERSVAAVSGILSKYGFTPLEDKHSLKTPDG